MGPDFASFMDANTYNGVADIIFARLRLDVIHQVSFCKIPRVRAMEGEGELEEEGEEEVDEPQPTRVKRRVRAIEDDEHTARLRRIKRMRTEDTASPGAGSSSEAAPQPKARPRPLFVYPDFVYICIKCQEIVRAHGIEDGTTAIRRCSVCYYPLCPTCWIRRGAKLHCPDCMTEASDSDILALQRVEDDPDDDSYERVEDAFIYDNTGRSRFNRTGKGKDKDEGGDDPKGNGKGKEMLFTG